MWRRFRLPFAVACLLYIGRQFGTLVLVRLNDRSSFIVRENVTFIEEN